MQVQCHSQRVGILVLCIRSASHGPYRSEDDGRQQDHDGKNSSELNTVGMLLISIPLGWGACAS